MNKQILKEFYVAPAFLSHRSIAAQNFILAASNVFKEENKAKNANINGTFGSISMTLNESVQETITTEDWEVDSWN